MSSGAARSSASLFDCKSNLDSNHKILAETQVYK